MKRKRKGPKLGDLSFPVRMKVMAARFRRHNWWVADEQTLANLCRIIKRREPKVRS